MPARKLVPNGKTVVIVLPNSFVPWSDFYPVKMFDLDFKRGTFIFLWKKNTAPRVFWLNCFEIFWKFHLKTWGFFLIFWCLGTNLPPLSREYVILSFIDRISDSDPNLRCILICGILLLMVQLRVGWGRERGVCGVWVEIKNNNIVCVCVGRGGGGCPIY